MRRHTRHTGILILGAKQNDRLPVWVTSLREPVEFEEAVLKIMRGCNKFIRIATPRAPAAATTNSAPKGLNGLREPRMSSRTF